MTQKDIELILLRQWASYLTMPIFLAGADGNLLFYNEPAEAFVGRPFEQVADGELSLGKLTATFRITSPEGKPLRTEDLAISSALVKRRPAHDRIRYEGLDGIGREIEITAFPLDGQGGRNLGAVAIFWEAGT